MLRRTFPTIMASYLFTNSDDEEVNDTANGTPRTYTGGNASLSSWSSSRSKRLFDLACFACALPLALPILLLTAITVGVTSGGPVLFRQRRIGRYGRPFTIYKFRTMPARIISGERPEITTSTNQKFTAVGVYLRRWKLDELPQIFNVLRGDMSLVGPRPKIPNHQTSDLTCLPGITGYATLTFANEEAFLADLSADELDALYHSVILPFKGQLDREYMSIATFTSDLHLIMKSIFRRWNEREYSDLLFSGLSSVMPSPKIRIADTMFPTHDLITGGAVPTMKGSECKTEIIGSSPI